MTDPFVYLAQLDLARRSKTGRKLKTSEMMLYMGLLLSVRLA